MSEITMDDAVLAGDNTLHGAIDYWQNKCQHQQSRIDDLEAQLAIAVDAMNQVRRDYGTIGITSIIDEALTRIKQSQEGASNNSEIPNS